MKKKLYVLLTALICVLALASCSFFGGSGEDQNPTTEDKQVTDTSTEKEENNTKEPDTEETTTEETTTEKTTTEETAATEEAAKEQPVENPRENVAENKDKEFTTIGFLCGFADSNSVEIQFEDGSYCTFFAFDEDVKETLIDLSEQDMPKIEFTYKARDGQVNPEIIAVR